MKRPQLHLYLTPMLAELLKERAAKYGFTPGQYVKFILVKDLDAHPINLNIRAVSKQVPLGRSGYTIKETQEIY